MENKINCPKCSHKFSVEDVISQQIEEKYREEYGGKISEMEKSFQQKQNALKKQEQELKAKSADMERQIEAKAKAEAAVQAEAIKKKVAEDFEVKIQSLTAAESEAKQKLTDMRATQLENENLKRKLNEQKEESEIEYQRRLSQEIKAKTEAIRNSEKESFDLIRQREKEESELRIKELEKKYADQKALTDEMKRKQEQGSMQLQGEVQELTLENMLRDLYERKGDEISEIKKGQRGADVLHVIKTQLGDTCGKIYYESKRTQAFNNEWLQKLRDDNIEVGADILVLVTQTMPAGQERFFHKDGVWICSLWEVKGLSMVLREGVQKVHETRSVQHDKESKMEELYDYLTSNEFAAQFGAILDGFKSLQDSHLTEKRRMETFWKEREKQLDKVLRNSARFYGSIRHIAGRSVPEMKLLETPDVKVLEIDSADD